MKLCFYFGGFARLGGIEVFASDLLTALSPLIPDRELIYWGPEAKLIPELRRMEDSGVVLYRSAFRWGSRWNWPDRCLFRLAHQRARQADILFFGKILSADIHDRLRHGDDGRRPRIVVSLPYHPTDYLASCYANYLRAFDVIIVQAHSWIDVLRSQGFQCRIEELPYLPPETRPVSRLPPLDPGSPFKLGFLGRFAPQKNLSYLLEVFAHLATAPIAGSPWELHLFGDGDERTSLQKQCHSLGISKSVFFHGVVRDEAKLRAIDSCHLFVNTSRSEGQCLVALEVLARGRRLVATPAGALPEILNNPVFGYIAPFNDPKVFADLISRSMQELHTDMNSGRSVQMEYVKQFPRDQIRDRYAALFRSLV